jgi:hypothetical protein
MLIIKIESVFCTKVKLKVEEPVAEDVSDNISLEKKMSPVKEEVDLIGTPLECPFDLDVLKIQDEEFYSRESMESHHKTELKTCPYKPFSSFEARYKANVNKPLYKVITIFFVSNYLEAFCQNSYWIVTFILPYQYFVYVMVKMGKRHLFLVLKRLKIMN